MSHFDSNNKINSQYESPHGIAIDQIQAAIPVSPSNGRLFEGTGNLSQIFDEEATWNH